jgi:hypothetical protein
MKVSSSVLRGAGGRTTPLASALALTLFTGLAASASAAYNPIIELSQTLPAAMLANTLNPSPAEGPSYYTIVFKEAPVATYDGSTAGIPAPGNVIRNGTVTGKVDVKSPAAQAYVSHLQIKQQAFLDTLSATLNRPLDVMARMQHALNAVIVRLSAAEASAIMKRPDVLFIEREHMLELDTDRGPSFIGATAIWGGSTASGVATKGEGILFGDIDSGINWESPAFAAVGPNDGYVHLNPLGTGNYLGQCAPGGVDAGKCNDKLIGMYNFAAPGTTATDIEGHGSHTASTVAGNTWNAIYASGPFTISGVAPHANVIAYLACPTTSCPSSATSQSANQAVADGVDVINYSISGGTSPWTDATSTAFRNAVAGGAFVAASAGNTSTSVPNPQGQVNHMEPWVETVAASTEDRILAVSLDLTSEASPPANTQNIPMRPGGAPLPTVNLVDVPLIKSPNFANGSTDGCSAYPANTFVRSGAPTDRIFFDGFDIDPPPPVTAGAVAVLHLDGTASSCGSGTRRANALAAGAVGVIFVDAVYLNLGANLTSWSMLMSDWSNLEAGSNPTTATVSIDIAAQSFPGPGDQIASFSFRGPRLVGGQGMVKPDITAPGVDILAVGASSLVGPNGVILLNGTSMSSPHMAGSAVLMRALNPTWSATQVKSALNLSSNNFGAINQDGSPVRLWDYGSGRVNLAAASKVGLIMDETSANFLAANPAAAGDISTLNLASISKYDFINDATFTRTFRRARSGAQTYNLSVAGFPAGAVEFTPASFLVSSSGSSAVTVTAHGLMLNQAQWNLGELILTPAGGDEPTLHLPIALSPSGPKIQTAPASISGSSDTTVSNDLTISNIGNPTLNWSVTTTGTAQVTPLNTTTSGSGELGGYYTGDMEGDYISQNFDTLGATHITTLRANGFTLPGGSSLTTANTPGVTFSIYADNAGEPAGAPEAFGSTPVWTYSSTIGAGTGITTTGGNLQLNLAAAGVPSLDLPPGRHWMTVYPTITGSSASLLWAWRSSPDAQIGSAPVVYAPYFDNANFLPISATAMSAFVQGTVSCALPSWVNLTTSSGSLGLGGSQMIPVEFNAAGLSAGTYTATLCIGSNATNIATVVVPLTFTVPNGGAMPPTISKAFAPTSVETGVSSTLTITLNNAGPTATLSADLTDTFPSGLVVAASPAASTTCPSGSVTAVAGAGLVSLGSGAQIPGTSSCTVTVDVSSAAANVYANTIPAGALQTSAGNNAASADASLTVTAPVFDAPTTAIGFAPSSVAAGTPSTMTITLGNTNAVVANLTAPLADNLPAGVRVAPTPNAATSCASGVVTAVAGSTVVSLASGAQIPATGNCTVTVDVRAVSPGSFNNTVAAGALQTDLGNSTALAAAALNVTAGTFPAPYCARAFTSAVEPITLVSFANVSNVTSATVGGTPALENFLGTSVNVLPGATYSVTVQGNSDGNFLNVYRAYIDWNQDGVFAEDASERYELGSITNSTGADAKQTSGLITIPMSAVAGTTRLRVVKNFNAAGLACTSSSFGQAEDYTVTLDPGAPPPPPIAAVSKAFSPAFSDVAGTTTLTISLSQLNGAGTATTTAALTDTLPAGMTVAATPNASTTCPAGVVTAVAAAGTVTLESGAQIPAVGCSVTVSVQAASPGQFTNTIAVGALQTSIGNSLTAASAVYRGLATGPTSYSTGFESPFTVGGVSGQQGWGTTGTAGNSTVSAALPGAGLQHLRITSTAATSGTTTGALPPTQVVTTGAYSVMTAKVRITRNTNGAIFDLNPQDPVAGVVSTLLRFEKSTTRAIQIVNWNTGLYEATGATWPLATYFDISLAFNRAGGTLKVCVDGTTIYNGASAVSSPYIGNIIAKQTGAASSTAGNTMDVDDLVISNTDTAPVCTP